MESIRTVSISVAFLFCLSGCGSKYVTIHPEPELTSASIERIAVQPILVRDGRQGTFKTGSVEERGQRILTDLIYEVLERNPVLTLIPRARAEKAFKQVLEKDPDAPLLDRGRRLGEALGVPVVLSGLADIFEERIGESYGIQRPAAVGFELFLVRTEDGTVLWKGSYYETQQPLSADITNFSLFLKRKGRWQTATELARYGVEEVLTRSGWATE